MDVSLRYTQDTFGRIFSLPALRKLSIRRCSGADAFFAEAPMISHGMSLDMLTGTLAALQQGCAAHLPAWACSLAEMGLYLVPSLALAFLLWIVTAAHPLFFVFSAVGTLCHELAHFSVGLLLGAEPTNFSIVPRRTGRTWELGSSDVVTVSSQLKTWNRSFTLSGSTSGSIAILGPAVPWPCSGGFKF